MSTDTQQQIPYFGTPINVANLARMRLLRLRVGDGNAERILAWYVQMRDLAKQGSTFGEFTTNVILFAQSIGVEVPGVEPYRGSWIEEAATIWEAFQAPGVELIEVDGDVSDIAHLFRVTVLDYAETNTSRPSRVASSRDVTPMTPAERKAKGRENARRRDAGMPPMSREEADSWLKSRRVTSHVTPVASRHAIQDTQDETDETDHHHEPAAVVTEPIEPSLELPKNQRSPEARIRQAQRDLESHASTYVLGLIARRNGASDNLLSPLDEFQRYWKPACDLLAAHGRNRLREAMNAPGAAKATSLQYVATIAGRLRDEAAATSTHPDVGTGDWDHLTPKAS